MAITERDIDVMALVGLCRYVSAEQIAREFFPTTDRCRRRLRQLFDAGFVGFTLRSSTLPNLVSLTRTGLAAVSDRLPELASRLRLPGPLRTTAVHHHLAVVDARLFAARVGAETGTPLVSWQGDASDPEFAELRLHPDGLAEFAGRDGNFLVAMEVDCGSEPLATIEKKLDRYDTLIASGAIEGVWLVVAAGRGRAVSLQELVRRTGRTAWLKIVGREETSARCPVAADRQGAQGKRAAGPNSAARNIAEAGE